MKRLLLATTNRGKVDEMTEALSGLGLRLLSLSGWGPLPEPVENGDSFAANARLKAYHYHRLTGWPALADDSGLQVRALGGAPGLHSSRYASTDALRIGRLLRELDRLEAAGRAENRLAKFVCAVCLVGPQTMIEAEGEVHGRITSQPKGDQGFGYDPVFFHPSSNRTFGEIDRAVKNRISHRAKALEKLKNLLSRMQECSGEV